jgi:LacI family transcriptional regulator
MSAARRQARRVNGARAPDEPGAPNGRRATIQDVAKAAGVSVSAVSKVLRGAYGVSPTMHARVSAAVEELKYRPNTGARAMRGRSYTIGVVLSDLMSPFQPELAQGISHVLEPTPYQEIIIPGGTSTTQQTRSIEALLDRRVDGLVLVSPWMPVAWIEQLAARLPVVAIALHGPSENFDTVFHDQVLGARLVVDYLVEAGHTNMVHTGMPAGDLGGSFVLSHTARRQGFERAVREHGLEPDVIETWYSEEGGYQATRQALDRRRPPTAIFAGADIAALGALRAADELGVRVPDDVSIVGFDNIYASTINRVSLTTVDTSGQQTGETTARLLLERINGRTEPIHRVLTPELIIRSTSGQPRSPR